MIYGVEKETALHCFFSSARVSQIRQCASQIRQCASQALDCEYFFPYNSSMDSYTSFDRLVTGISQTERDELLRKIQTTVDPDSQSLVSEEMITAGDCEDLDIKFKSESLFLRIWLYIKALFSNTEVRILYNDQLVKQSGRDIEKKYPDLIDAKSGVFRQDFYDKLIELRRCAEFFKQGVDAYEDNPGDFYVSLGSLIAPEVALQMSTEANPAALPYSREVTNELRASMLRKMDEVLQSILPAKRSALYTAVIGAEWIRQFVRLPFERLLAGFTEIDSFRICSFQNVKSEIAQFAKVLCNGKRIQTEVLEAFCVFPIKDVSDQKMDIPAYVGDYIEKATAQISLIKMFIDTVPLRAIGSVVFGAAEWTPERPDGCEDWFIKYKNTWRKLFDRNWEIWLENRKKNLVLQSMQLQFGMTRFPLLPNRPWSENWGGVSFRYDYALGFIYGFFTSVYPEYAKLLKILMLEGDFYQKDNQVEFTDSCAELDRQKNNIDRLNAKLSETGETGALFAKYNAEMLRSTQGKPKLEALMKSVETESAVIIAQWCAASRTIQLVLEAVLSGARNSRYDSISNLSGIQGKQNQSYRQKLADVKNAFVNALDIVKELETFKTTGAGIDSFRIESA